MDGLRETRQRKTRNHKQVDPLLYAGYFDDNEDIRNIEYQFYQMEQLEKKSDNSEHAQEEIARKVFRDNADPSQLPNVNEWIEIDSDDAQFRSDDEDFVIGIHENSDDEDSRGFISYNKYSPGHRQKKDKIKKDKSHQMQSTALQISYIGGGVEIWPCYKIERRDIINIGPIVHTSYQNVTRFQTREAWKEKLNLSTYKVVDNLDVHTLISIAGRKFDAILMDPPFDKSWTMRRFRNFIHDLLPYLSRTFLVVWADPAFLRGIVEAFKSCNLVFCDSIAVELLDELQHQYIIIDPTGFPRDSRMAIMYRTDDITRGDLKQQRVKDTGYGITQRSVKSFNRPGTPSTLHEIIETMLPATKGHPRTFVELWPGFFDRRPGWILIDEKSETKVEEIEQSESSDFSIGDDVFEDNIEPDTRNDEEED